MQMITFFVGQLPQLIICIVAMVFGVSRWNQHPKAAMLVTLGATLELGASIGSSLTIALAAEHLSASMMSPILGVIHLGGVIGFGCIVAAVFVDRPRV